MKLGEADADAAVRGRARSRTSRATRRGPEEAVRPPARARATASRPTHDGGPADPRRQGADPGRSADHAEKLGKGKALKDKGKALSDKLTAIEKKLVNPDVKANQDVLNFPPALDHQFAGIASVVASRRREADGLLTGLPTGRSQAELDAIQAELKAVLDKDLAAFNKAVRDADIPPVVVVDEEEARRDVRPSLSPRERVRVRAPPGRSQDPGSSRAEG